MTTMPPTFALREAARRADCRRPVLLFDDGCSICRRFVSFAVKVDHHDRLRIAPLNSVFGDAIRRSHSQHAARDSSLFVQPDGAILSHSDAIVAALREVGGGWRMLGHVLHALPRQLRDRAFTALTNRRTSFARAGLPELDPRADRRRLTIDQMREMTRG